MRLLRHRIASPLAALALACGGGGSSELLAPSLTVSPTEWSVPAGGAPKQFTATLTGSGDPVLWSIEPAGTPGEVGTISGTGLYAPPPSLASGRDVFVKATAGALVARASVHIGAAVDGVTLTVTPPTASVVAGSGDAVALHAETNHAGAVTWTVVPDLGTLDASTGTDVTYSAPTGLVTAATGVVVTATAGAVSDGTTITVRPTVLQVTGPATVRAGGAPVAFTVTTDVGGRAVAWSVTPASAGTISGTWSSATFTPAASVAAATPFQVVATIDEAAGSFAATLLPSLGGPITVAGTVTDERGAGVPGAKVIIGGQSTTSGTDGSFTIPSVAPPYDATVVAEGGKTVSVFRGVEDAAPVLWFVASHGSLRSATVSGRVTAASQPQPGVRVFSPSRWSTSSSSGDYSMLTVWTGDVSTTLPFRALLTGLDPVSAKPTAYAFGSRSVVVTDGGTVTGQDIDVALVPSGRVTGETTPDGDLDLTTSQFTVVARFADGTAFAAYEKAFSFSDMLVGPFDVVIPTLPGAGIHLGYGASGTSGGRARARANVVPGQAGVSLALPLIPVGTAPANGASGVGHGTAFGWTSPNAGGTTYLNVDCAGGASYRIHGGASAATIPDLSAHGVSLAAGASCTWSPGWASYAIADLVDGPAAIEALAVERGAYGPTRSFTF